MCNGVGSLKSAQTHTGRNAALALDHLCLSIPLHDASQGGRHISACADMLGSQERALLVTIPELPLSKLSLAGQLLLRLNVCKKCAGLRRRAAVRQRVPITAAVRVTGIKTVLKPAHTMLASHRRQILVATGATVARFSRGGKGLERRRRL